MLIIQVLFLQRIIRKKGGDTEKMSENLPDKPEKIATNTEEIGSTTEKIPEIMPEKIRHKGQRGPDKTPRRFNQNSLRNLMQYKNNIFEEKKSIWKKPEFWLGVSGTIIAFSILAFKLYEALNKSRQEDSEEEIKELEEK